MSCIICSKSVFPQVEIQELELNNIFSLYCEILSLDLSHPVDFPQLNIFCVDCTNELNQVLDTINSIKLLQLEVDNFKRKLKEKVLKYQFSEDSYECQNEQTENEFHTAHTNEIRPKMCKDLSNLVDQAGQHQSKQTNLKTHHRTQTNETLIKTEDTETIYDEDEDWTNLSQFQTETSYDEDSFTRPPKLNIETRKEKEKLEQDKLNELKAKALRNEFTIKIKRLEESTMEEIHCEIASNRPSTLFNPFQCTHCFQIFKDKHTFQRHMKLHTGDGKITSQNESTEVVKVYINRVKTFKSSNEKTCLLCGSHFLSIPSYRSHLKIHEMKDRRIQCTICGTILKSSHYLETHMAIHKEEKDFKCAMCEKQFTRSFKLQNHMRLHTGERPFKCKLCKKAYRSNESLTQHSRIHNPEFNIKPKVECEICGKTMGTTNMKFHMRSHNEDSKLKCSLCPKSFISNEGLKHHMMIHTGEKPFECSICQKRYRLRASYNMHMKYHSGYRNLNQFQATFICEICGKSMGFNNKKTHMKIHNKQKDFQCFQCGKTFYRKTVLTYHMRSHTGETPFLCPVCGKGFAVGWLLNQHMKNHDSVQTG